MEAPIPKIHKLRIFRLMLKITSCLVEHFVDEENKLKKYNNNFIFTFTNILNFFFRNNHFFLFNFLFILFQI